MPLPSARSRSAGPSLVVAALAAALGGCASAGVPPMTGPPRTQPPALVGRWRLAAATDPTRAPVRLLLDASAVAETERVAERAGAPPVVARSYWWVYAAEGALPARLCVGWRPRRGGGECLAFAVDSAGAARRLTWGSWQYVPEALAAGAGTVGR